MLTTLCHRNSFVGYIDLCVLVLYMFDESLTKKNICLMKLYSRKFTWSSPVKAQIMFAFHC